MSPTATSSSPELGPTVPGSIANLARQPIFDAKLATVGYQLLYRSADAEKLGNLDPTRATSVVLSNVLAEFGLEAVVGSLPAWVSFPPQYLTEGLPIPLGPKALVISLDDSSPPTDELIERLRGLKQQGYRIAVNGTYCSSGLSDLIKVAAVARVDVHGRDAATVASEARVLLKHGVRLLANRIETMAEYHQCLKAGFALFEGYFICRPELMRQRRVPTNRVVLVQLLSELYAEDPNIEKVRQLVQQDVTLSYRLLKWLNSSLFALPHPIESISHALVMLGLNRLRNLVSLIVLSRIDDKPGELVTTSLMRARIGERMAPALKLTPESMFTVGLFSLLDALIGVPMDQVLETMPLTPDIQRAILNREGPHGKLLLGIEAHERGDWDGIERSGLDLGLLTPAWVDASVWVRRIRGLTAASAGGSPGGPASRR